MSRGLAKVATIANSSQDFTRSPMPFLSQHLFYWTTYRPLLIATASLGFRMPPTLTSQLMSSMPKSSQSSSKTLLRTPTRMTLCLRSSRWRPRFPWTPSFLNATVASKSLTNSDAQVRFNLLMSLCSCGTMPKARNKMTRSCMTAAKVISTTMLLLSKQTINPTKMESKVKLSTKSVKIGKVRFQRS